MITGKTIALTRWIFVIKMMSLLFNTLSRFVIAFLPKKHSSSHSMAAVTIHSDFRAQENKICCCFHFSPFICCEMMGLDVMILVFLMLSFKPAFSFSSFTLIKKPFSYSSLSAIRVVSSAYLRLLIFLPVMLIPACDSSSPAFHMMYSVYKLNKQGDSVKLCCTPFPILNQSIVLCLVLTVASWLAYRFLRRQERWSGIPISLRIFHSLLWPL